MSGGFGDGGEAGEEARGGVVGQVGDWTVTSRNGGIIHFRRRSKPQVTGTITIHPYAGAGRTAVNVRM